MRNANIVDPPIGLRAVAVGMMVATGVAAQDAAPVAEEVMIPDGLAAAQSAAAMPPVEQAEALALDRAGETRKPFNLYAGLDAVTMYVSRGQAYSSKASLQPWLEVDAPLAQGGGAGPFDTISWFVGTWASVQEGDAGLSQTRSSRSNTFNLDNIYEVDVYTGVRVTFMEHFGGSLRFNYYTSPSDSWEDIHEIDLRLMYDDSHWWTDEVNGFSLNPSIRIAKETRDRGGTERWYFRPQLEPSYTFPNLAYPLTVTMPLVLGFGADRHYVDAAGNEEHFGFFQTGVVFSGPLDVLPEGKGRLRWSAGVDVIIASDDDITFRNDQVMTVGKVGVSYSY